VVERPVAVLGNEREPVCMFFLQLIAPLIRVVALCSSMPLALIDYHEKLLKGCLPCS
jgi:hypothetical protein